MTGYIVTCAACKTGNRIPAEKEGQKGHCGQCHAILPSLYYRPQQLGDATFDRFISAYSEPVLVEFWAPWCPHCVSYTPTIQKVAEKMAGKAAVVQINSQENPALAARFGVRGIPVIMLLKNGRIIDQLAGAQSVEAVLGWVSKHA